jgi:hypothetical protein|tara:strand:+ start:782 stop:955 length:174 start_codon:yes stop_codon:yes gene_type:complete
MKLYGEEIQMMTKLINDKLEAISKSQEGVIGFDEIARLGREKFGLKRFQKKLEDWQV